MKKITRRDFLKVAGTAVVGAAAYNMQGLQQVFADTEDVTRGAGRSAAAASHGLRSILAAISTVSIWCSFIS